MEISFEGIPTMVSATDLDFNKLMHSGAVKQIDNKFFVIFKKQIIEFSILTNGFFWINNIQKIPCAKYRIPEILPDMTQAQITAVYIEKERLVRRLPLNRQNFDIYGTHKTLRCG